MVISSEEINKPVSNQQGFISKLLGSKSIRVFIIVCIGVLFLNEIDVYNLPFKSLMNTEMLSINEHKGVKAYRVGIAIELSDRKRDISEMSTMVLPSWKYVSSLATLNNTALKNHKLIGNIDIKQRMIPDLLIFCEYKACKYISNTHGCMMLTKINVKYNKKYILPQCYYHVLSKKYFSEVNDYNYPFITSLYFLRQKMFRSIYNYYDYIIRCDADSFITPLILIWKPKYDYAFGNGFMGTEFTEKRLEYVASTLNLTHNHVHSMQSSWYIKTKPNYIFESIINMTIDLTQYFYENEFIDEKCKIINNITKYGCDWPDWHRGVSSLYAQNLAINHVLSSLNITQKWVTTKLDGIATSNGEDKVNKIVQVHLLQDKHKHFGELEEMHCDLINKFSTEHFISLKKVEYSKNIKDYVKRILGHSIRDHCISLMFRR